MNKKLITKLLLGPVLSLLTSCGIDINSHGDVEKYNPSNVDIELVEKKFEKLKAANRGWKTPNNTLMYKPFKINTIWSFSGNCLYYYADNGYYQIAGEPQDSLMDFVPNPKTHHIARAMPNAEVKQAIDLKKQSAQLTTGMTVHVGSKLVGKVPVADYETSFQEESLDITSAKYKNYAKAYHKLTHPFVD